MPLAKEKIKPEERLAVCFLLTNSEETEPLYSSQILSSAGCKSTKSLLSHHIPSPKLDVDNEMCRWTQTQSFSPRSPEPSLLIESFRKDCLGTRCNHFDWGVEHHQNRSQVQIMDTVTEDALGKVQLFPSPIPSQREKSGTSPALCDILQNQTCEQHERRGYSQRISDSESHMKSDTNSGPHVSLIDFNFNFESTPGYHRKMIASTTSHSPLPSLSHSSSSSPPATPPMPYIQACRMSPQPHENQLVSDHVRKTYHQSSNPTTYDADLSKPDFNTAAAVQCRQNDRWNFEEVEYLACRPAPVVPANVTPIEMNSHLSSVEISFIDWDDTTRLAKVKKSFSDLRRNNANRVITKKRKPPPKHLRITKNDSSNILVGTRAQISLPSNPLSDNFQAPVFTTADHGAPSSVISQGDLSTPKSFNLGPGTSLPTPGKLTKVKNFWGKVVGKSDAC